ncbi:MAG: ZmpA/ZmpB/ZmpC family metallo-endopeptidase-related protein, partial [Syntrophomonas sp.]|nr:ZmpA/ZmpB/ZmpC family metallo-endopeptidase-related protein [Syntrophomonas sp.]
MRAGIKKAIKWMPFIIILFLLSSSSIFYYHIVEAVENGSTQLSNTNILSDSMLFHETQAQERYLDMQKRLQEIQQLYEKPSVQETSVIQSNSSLLMEGEQSVIPIHTVNDLINISQNMSESYILMSDIDLSEVPDWTPLGGHSNQFTGTLDGNSYAIRNLNSTHGGLFSEISGGTVRNLNFFDVSINATSDSAAAVAVYCENGTITNCTVTGTITSNSIAGILVVSNNSTISDCSVNATLLFKNNAGGIVNLNFNGASITNCTSSGIIQSTGSDFSGHAGGIVEISNGGEITECTSSATITASSTDGYAGGIVAEIYEGAYLSNCSATGNISGHNAGGLVEFSSNGTISNCSAAGSVSGSSEFGGFVAEIHNNTDIQNCTATGNTSGENIGGFVYHINNSTISNCSAAGSVSSSDNAGGFAGQCFNNTVIQNCTATGNISGKHIGGFVYHISYSTTISNCSAAGSVSSSNDAGGFAGECYYNTVISSCYSTGDVIAQDGLSGGFIGFLGESCLISDCWSEGNVSNNSNYPTGGFAAYCFGGAQDCRAYGSVEGLNHTGGFLGFCGTDKT